MTKYSLFIGRCQIPHNTHFELILEALNNADVAIVALGSHRAARSPKNPFTCEEREAMIRSMFVDGDNARLKFIYLKDFTYQDDIWLAQVQAKVDEIAGDDHVGLIYSRRENDKSSYYLDLLPYDKIGIHKHNTMSATDIRNVVFATGVTPNVRKMVQPEIVKALEKWMETDSFKALKKAHTSNLKYAAQYAGNEFPQINVTTDYILERAGHVLLIRRKFDPGKGLLALPGGYVEHNLPVEQSALKELKEETRIKMPLDEIKNHVVACRHFDQVDRDLRCRTITFAYYAKLPKGPLPQVKGGDDAAHAKWIPKSELSLFEPEFYADHFHIMNWFFNNVRG